MPKPAVGFDLGDTSQARAVKKKNKGKASSARASNEVGDSLSRKTSDGRTYSVRMSGIEDSIKEGIFEEAAGHMADDPKFSTMVRAMVHLMAEEPKLRQKVYRHMQTGLTKELSMIKLD